MKNQAAVGIPKLHFELIYVNTHYATRETLMSSYTSFVVPRGSPLQANYTFFNLYTLVLIFDTTTFSFQSTFQNDVMWLRDSGILDKLKYDIIIPPFPILDPKVRRDQPLVMNQLGIVIIVLAVGLILSLPVFFCEFMKGRGKNNLNEVRNVREPVEREDPRSLIEVANLTLQSYGRDLAEYL